MEYDVIISLTTWKKRINDINLPKILFRVLAQQKTKYKYKVVLVLSSEEFGNNYKLPNVLTLLNEKINNFEILWTTKNTKALKKLDPVMEKYPELPIITMDDDELLCKNAIEVIMNYHKQYPKDILGTICGIHRGMMRVGEFRLFPPHSLYTLDTNYFEEYFNCMQDDEWNGIRARLAGTNMRKIKERLVEKQNYGSQKDAFRKEYSKFNFNKAYQKFKCEHPEYNL